MKSLRARVVGLVRTASTVRYGLVAQTFSSATNFGLIVVAGHVLGPDGVGTLFVGFSVYLVLLGFHRSLVTTPLVVTSAPSDPIERAARDRFALTLTLAVTIPLSGILAVIGLVLPEQLGRGMLLFAPWLVPTLVQDLGRSIVFRDRSGRSTVLTDAMWVFTMAALAPLAFKTASDWVVVGCWGAGGVCGAAVVSAQVGWRPAPLRNAIRWWKAEASRFGGWLAMSGTLYSVTTYFSVLALVSILGASEYGGLRAVQTLFAPLTLLGPALSLPGLPLVSRLVSHSPRQALQTALRFGALIMVLTALYVAVLYGFPGLLGFFFGQGFTEFRSIIVPIGVGQILLAPALGLGLFIKAQQRGRLLFWSTSLYSLLSVILAVAFASLFGLIGAAWAGVIAASVYVLALIAAIRPRSIIRTPPTGTRIVPSPDRRI